MSSFERTHQNILSYLKELIDTETNKFDVDALESVHKLHISTYETFTALKRFSTDALLYNACGWLVVFTYLLIYKNPHSSIKRLDGGEGRE